MRTSKSFWLGLLALGWCFGIILVYYVYHKPFTPDLALSLIVLIGRLVIVGTMLSVAGGIGSLLFSPENLNPLARAAVQAALGLGAMSLVFLAMGVTVGIHLWALWLILIGLFVLLFKPIRAWWRSLSGVQSLWSDSDSLGRTYFILLSFILFCGLVIALASPFKYDALMYHLTMPEAYLQAGKVIYLPWMVMSGMPQVTEMLYTWAMGLGGAPAATTLGWGFGLLALLGLMGYLRQRLDLKAAWAGAVSLLAGYTLAVSMAWGYVDWLGLFFGFGCLVMLDLWRQEGGFRNLVLAGVFAGLAFGTKYTAGVLLAVSGMTLLWHVWKRKSNLIVSAFEFGIAALVAMAPWLIKDWLTTGNPLYPFFFTSGAMDAQRIAVYQGLPAWGNWQDFFLMPLRMTLIGSDTSGGYGVSMGPLLLGLGALAWLGWSTFGGEKKAALENAALLAVTGVAIWAVGNQLSGYLIQTRMYFSLFPAFVVLAAYGYHGISQIEIKPIRLRFVVNILLVFVLALNVIQVGMDFVQSGALNEVLGGHTEEQYLTDNLGWFQPTMQAIKALPQGSKVLMLYEPRGFYCIPGCDPDEILDQWQHDQALYHIPQAIIQNWQQEGFTQVLYYKAGGDFLRSSDDPHHSAAEIDSLESLLSTLPTLADFGGVYRLYSLENH
ncbi:MAG TPA: hypothetical protein VMC62_08865 [Longilinea sp.]|nr:hypothetical protein [Longilinea sp.]